MTILNTFEYVEGAPAWLVYLLFGVGILFLIGEIIFISGDELAPCIGCAICALVLLCSAIVLAGTESSEKRYECTIDEGTSFSEVTENYDVVGRRGDIWILRDKVENE